MPPLPPLLRATRDRSRDKALLIGLDYRSSGCHDVRPLDGTHEDIKLLATYLTGRLGYREKNVRTILDDDPAFYERDVRAYIVCHDHCVFRQ